jgi:tRNA-2-methylthio-N6-dimethylallyladenosine synthase
MLKRMARGYQVRHYRAIVERARELMPEIGLYTDIIVGFSGETEEMFGRTRALMEEVEFDVVHLAQYSVRPGTVAGDRWPDDVPAEVKRERINELLTLQREIAARRTRRWLGHTVEVLVEAADELGRPYGRNRQGKRTAIRHARLGAPRALAMAGAPGAIVSPGDLVQVRVEEATPGQLAGSLVA